MDKRIIKTKKNISDALLSLIEKKESSKITVSEITNLAGIERKTFYLHYSCIEDVYKDLEDHISIDLETEARKVIDDPNYQIKNIYYSLNFVLNNNLNFFKAIAKNDSYSFLLHSFEKILSKVIGEIATNICKIKSNNLKYYCDFYAAGILKLYTKWLRNEIDLTLDELTNILTRASFLSINELIETKSA